MGSIQFEGLVEQLAERHRPETDGCACGGHGAIMRDRPPACPASGATGSVRAGAAAATGAAARARCARGLAARQHGEGREHRLRVAAFALRTHLARVAAGITAKDIEGMTTAEAGELVDRHDHIVRMMSPPLQQYAELLLDWNRRVNLTGARTLEQVEAQIADADVLLAASWVAVQRVTDIGSGGGLPAVPLALARPAVHFTLLEANARKCAFLEHVAGTLELRNVAVLAGRAEELGHQPSVREQFDRAISRAAAPAPVLLELALPFVTTGGDLIAEVSAVDPPRPDQAARLLGARAPSVERPVAGGTALLVVQKLAPTPAKFPRRP